MQPKEVTLLPHIIRIPSLSSHSGGNPELLLLRVKLHSTLPFSCSTYAAHDDNGGRFNRRHLTQ